MVDNEAILKICEVFDREKSGKVDLFFLGEIFYAMGLRATKKICLGLGQSEEEGKLFASYGDIRQKRYQAIMHPDCSLTGGLLFIKTDTDEEKQTPVVEVE